ncbi:hypothetical protein OOJ91_33665 [Micromonospora lupini]|uniref:hypothetical protein n=1 Tax=Micromonospora lupini TaxID=285679 RepID=UPI00224C8D42|nr:hypothetical protein [Micromonospora lupini]MCX5070795.1 hypothetical protein [Micromonospora lupini]
MDPLDPGFTIPAMTNPHIDLPSMARLPMIVAEVPCVVLGVVGAVMFPGAWWSWTMAALFTSLFGLSLYARWHSIR